MDALLRVILDDDRAMVKDMLSADSSLVSACVSEARFYDQKIFHWLYAGDTALHLAAAGYRVEIVKLLVAAGADPNAAMNHRQSGPLHYAADGYIIGPEWDPERQVHTIEFLLAASADVNAQDKNGAAALHRAVRTRCSAAVRVLLKSGANPTLRNKPGSTPVSPRCAGHGSGRLGDGRSTSRTTRDHRDVSSVRRKSRDQGLQWQVCAGLGKERLDTRDSRSEGECDRVPPNQRMNRFVVRPSGGSL